jgi:transcriptional regulator with XRE-family HTH domain
VKGRRSRVATAQRRSARRLQGSTPRTNRSDEIARTFGTHLRKLRAEAGLRQVDLIGPGLGRAGVAKLEAGVSSPSLAILGHLAWVLDVPLKELVPPTL